MRKPRKEIKKDKSKMKRKGKKDEKMTKGGREEEGGG